MLDAVIISRVPVAKILPLRHAILRANLSFESANFDGDAEPTTAHFAAEKNGIIVGCCTFVRRNWNDQHAYQLRGMAVAAAVQKSGVGRRLLDAAEAFARDESWTQTLWANARTPAVPFYERLGWSRVGSEFQIQTAGPHFKILKKI